MIQCYFKGRNGIWKSINDRPHRHLPRRFESNPCKIAGCGVGFLWMVSTQNHGRISEKSLRNLKPFKPGNSGNPGGRPQTLAKYIREKTKGGITLADELFKIIKNKRNATRDRLAAVKLACEYGFGKPVQPISGPEGGPVEMNINLGKLGNTELEALHRLVEKATDPAPN
jgi:hypothetical protein